MENASKLAMQDSIEIKTSQAVVVMNAIATAEPAHFKRIIAPLAMKLTSFSTKSMYASHVMSPVKLVKIMIRAYHAKKDSKKLKIYA